MTTLQALKVALRNTHRHFHQLQLGFLRWIQTINEWGWHKLLATTHLTWMADNWSECTLFQILCTSVLYTSIALSVIHDRLRCHLLLSWPSRLQICRCDVRGKKTSSADAQRHALFLRGLLRNDECHYSTMLKASWFELLLPCNQLSVKSNLHPEPTSCKISNVRTATC